MLCLRDATPTRLGEVVRALSPSPPWAELGEVLHVCLRATEVLEVPPGSRVLLRVRVEDLDWLNIARPLFAERKLRTVLWANADAHEGLVRRAVDFYDWVSRTIAVPAKAVPDFAVERLRAAIHHHLGIAWQGPGLAETLKAAKVERSVELHVDQPYLQLLGALRGDRLPIVAGILTSSDVWRVRLALNDAERHGAWIALGCEHPIEGLRALDALQADWDTASDELRTAGWERPSLLAAWLGLDPEAIAAAIRRLGATPRSRDIVTQSATPHSDIREQVAHSIDAELEETELILALLHAEGETDQARTIAREWTRRTGSKVLRKSEEAERLIHRFGLGRQHRQHRGIPAGDLEGWPHKTLAMVVYAQLHACFSFFTDTNSSFDLASQAFARAVSPPATTRAQLFQHVRRVLLGHEHRGNPPDLESLTNDEFLQRMLSCSRSLPSDAQLLVYLLLAEQLSPSELAEVFDVPQGVVYRRIANALRQVTRCLDRAVVDSEM